MIRWLKNIGALTFGLILAIAIGELFLTVFEPIPFRVKGDKIILRTNRQQIIYNQSNKRLDSIITNTKNSLGLRGPEKPENFDEYTSMITVGGSTTYNHFLTDGTDWSSILEKRLLKKNKKVWVNNAGMDGHSTFGHLILLDEHLVHMNPDHILYLIGCNEVERSDLCDHEKSNVQEKIFSLRKWLREKSEVVGLIVNISRGLRAKKLGLIHVEMDLKNCEHIPIDLSQIQKKKEIQKPFLVAYKERLFKLVSNTINSGTTPILITQPTMVGEGIDNRTGINLETIKLIGEDNGLTYWTILEMYNDVTRQVAKQRNILLIDLAKEMPKSSNYFYDAIHFTKKGSSLVSKIIANELINNLELKASR